MERAKQLNVKFKKAKVQYKQKGVKVLGYIFSKEGRKADEKRFKSIKAL